MRHIELFSALPKLLPFYISTSGCVTAFSALTLLVGRQEGRVRTDPGKSWKVLELKC